MDEIKDLLEIAAKSTNLTNNDFDTFLKQHNFSEDDLSKRILMDELYLFYSHWYHSKYKDVPNRYRFGIGSEVLTVYRIRQRHPVDKKKLSWGIKCSVAFRIAYLTFKKENPGWEQKLRRIVGAKRSHKARKVNQAEQRQLEKLLSSQVSTSDSSPK